MKLKFLIVLIFLLFLSQKTHASSLQITEIFPDPKGKDKNSEWLEFYNATSNPINLEGWQIERKKKSTIKESIIIKPKSFFILEKNHLKFSLVNKNADLKLINPQGKTVQKIQYSKAFENQSFSQITINSNNKKTIFWQWTTATKNRQNPQFYEIAGTISQPPHSDFFIIKNQKNQQLKINFGKDFNPLILKIFLKEKTRTKLLISKNSSNYYLEKLKILHSL